MLTLKCWKIIKVDTLYHWQSMRTGLLVRVKNDTPFWTAIWQLLPKSYMYQSYDMVISLLGIYSIEIEAYTDKRACINKHVCSPQICIKKFSYILRTWEPFKSQGLSKHSMFLLLSSLLLGHQLPLFRVHHAILVFVFLRVFFPLYLEGLPDPIWHVKVNFWAPPGMNVSSPVLTFDE